MGPGIGESTPGHFLRVLLLQGKIGIQPSMHKNTVTGFVVRQTVFNEAPVFFRNIIQFGTIGDDCLETSDIAPISKVLRRLRGLFHDLLMVAFDENQL